MSKFADHHLQNQMLIRVIDDDEDVRNSYRFLLEGEGWMVRCYESAEQFLEKDNLKTPGCAIVDIRMEKMNGLELQTHLNNLHCSLPLIFLTGHGSVDMAVDALHAGAITFLTKPVPLQKLLEALSIAAEKVEEIISKDQDAKNWKSLTGKEKEVARLVCQGLLNKQIADKLNCSERTIQAHRTMVYRKLDVRNPVDVYKILLKLNLL